MSIKVLTVHFSIKMVNIIENCCNYTKPIIISALSRETGTELIPENKLYSVSVCIAACRALAPATPLQLGWGWRGGQGCTDRVAQGYFSTVGKQSCSRHGHSASLCWAIMWTWSTVLVLCRKQTHCALLILTCRWRKNGWDGRKIWPQVHNSYFYLLK